MHAPGHRSTVWIAIVTVMLTIGCRGSRPFGRLVEVSKEQDTSLPDIEAPAQRLATSKPRTDAEGEALRSRRADDSPHAKRTGLLTRSKQTRSSDVAVKEGRPTTDRKQVNASDQRSRTASSKKPTREKVASNSPTTKKASAKDAPAKADPSEIMDAFSDYPPEVQREALRRLVAATSRSAERTKQPNAVERELVKNISKLPELPDAKSAKPAIPPRRIASEESTAVASISDAADVKSNSNDSSASGHVTDLVTAELDSAVVQSDSDSDASEKNQVTPASASKTAGDESMIARALVETPSPVEASVQNDVAKKNKEESKSNTDTGASSVPKSDKELFAVLLKRLSAPVPGESEAERSSRLIKLRHLMVLAGDPDAAVGQVEGMSESEQEYLRHQLLGLWTMIDPDGHPVPSRRFSSAVPQIREAAKFAAAATDSLEVRSLAFCTEIESYGQIKTFPGNRFDSGQQVILYCEIENFTAKKTENGFETNLQGSYDIYNADDEKVVSQPLPADAQVSSNYLRDYFIAYQMHLPPQLSVGTYRMQLTMEDVNGKKYGQGTIPFEIAE